MFLRMETGKNGCRISNCLCKVVNGSLWNQRSGVLEPKEQFERRYSVGIIKVAASINNGTIPVRVFNLNDKPRRMYRGSNVGQFHSLDDGSLVEDEEQSCYSVRHAVIEDGGQSLENERQSGE